MLKFQNKTPGGDIIHCRIAMTSCLSGVMVERTMENLLYPSTGGDEEEFG